jgi:hypothetical protein
VWSFKTRTWIKDNISGSHDGNMNMATFWDVKPYSLVEADRHLRSDFLFMWWDWRLWTAATNGHIVHPQIWVWRGTVEWYWQGKPKDLGEKRVSVPLFPPQISHVLTWVRTRASVVRCRRLFLLPLLLYNIATKGITFSQDFWTHRD